MSDNVGPKKELVNRIQEDHLSADWRGKWKGSDELCDGEARSRRAQDDHPHPSNLARNADERKGTVREEHQVSHPPELVPWNFSAERHVNIARRGRVW